jgi:A/G-specific adenine glycosylase
MPHLRGSGFQIHESLLRFLPKSAPSPSPEKRTFQRSLLRWYKTHRRDLPWRKNHDPYRILVAEFMLQQTRVETVVPYFHRFLELFPTLESLAAAPLERVLRIWSGLGYYARARNLHAGAGIICRDLGGKIPSSRQNLLKLPGVGAYTAGAVASIAFHRPVPAVDGNVKRVIGRLFARDPSRISSKQDLEKFWAGWIPSGRASDFNQAMMDLGAGICGPLRPRCFECPVQGTCGSKGTSPRKREAPRKAREEEWAVALVEKDGRLLIHRNERRKLLGGLWQFPVIVSECGRNKNGKKALLSFLSKEFGINAKIEAALPELDYVFTHIRARVRPYRCSIAARPIHANSPEPVRWVTVRGLARYPVSTLVRKIAALFPARLDEPAAYPSIPPVRPTVRKGGRAARPSGSGRNG